jgi:hypothetical protein
MAKIPYKNWNAIQHAKAWCAKRDNPCGVFLDGPQRSDCAHFLAHCLKAGGIEIRNIDPGTALCPHGLAVRNTALVDGLRSLAGKYTNVREIGLSDAIVGDVGFLDRPDRPYHAFLICEPVDLRKIPPPSVKVYAHSTARCCEAMDAQWRQWFSTLFRLEDG